MGTFRVEVQAVGNHGCQREVKNDGVVSGCGQPGCVDCITREYVAKLKTSGAAYFDTTSRTVPDSGPISWARLTHWPDQPGTTVVDDILTGLRSGSF